MKAFRQLALWRESIDHVMVAMGTSFEDLIRRVEQNLMAWAAISYAGLSVCGSVFKIQWMRSLTTDPQVLVPAIATFLFLLIRRSIRQSDEIGKFAAAASHVLFQPTITSTHGSMWVRAESAKSRKVWATYLNPDAFKDGSVAPDLKDFYDKAESFVTNDYRRVFAIYPNVPKHKKARDASIAWIRNHVERTRALPNYQARYVEMEFQAAEMWIDDAGINFSFPSARCAEAGWATSDPNAIEMAKDYFHQLWERSRSVDELLNHDKPATA